jgi:3',5'-cyclic AMP phosphodiesterase CpdA
MGRTYGLCKYPPPRVYSLNAIRSTIIDFPATKRDPAFSVGIAGDRDDFSRRFRDQRASQSFRRRSGSLGARRVCGREESDVSFFVLDSNYMDPAQLDWLEQSLHDSEAKWKICYFHHPLYSDGKYHGPDLDLRAQVLPIFKRNGVNAVFSGHEHVYERLTPGEGIHYFILGNSAKLMTHDFRSKQDREVGVDTERALMIVEFAGDNLYFQTISRTGQTVDSGTVARR